jgi:hypothetical protein
MLPRLSAKALGGCGLPSHNHRGAAIHGCRRRPRYRILYWPLQPPRRLLELRSRSQERPLPRDQKDKEPVRAPHSFAAIPFPMG